MKDLKMMSFLLATATVCTVILGGAQMAYDQAASVFSRRLHGVVLEMFEVPFEEEEIESVFAVHFDTRREGADTFYVCKDPAPGTIVFKTAGPGLWSTIEVLLAVAPDREKLYGMHVLSQAETPGLGGRIVEAPFQEQFKGAAIQPRLEIVPFAMTDNQVDAISGATRTSVALQTIVNQGVRRLNQAIPIRKNDD